MYEEKGELMNKSKAVSMLITSALVTSALAVGTAAAAPPKKVVQTSTNTAAKFNVMNTSLIIDGQSVSLKSIRANKVTLYSVRELVEALGGSAKVTPAGIALNDTYGYHSVVLKANTKAFHADGEARQFTIAPIVSAGSLYVELTPVVTALGGELVSKNQVYTLKRLDGSFSNPHFDSQGNLLVTKEDGEMLQLFKLSPKLGTPSEVFSSSEGVAGVVVSPDHAWGAYTDNDGRMQLMDLSSGQVRTLGSDTTVKTDLTWSADGSKIYFIQGDKQEKISYISVDTGKVTEVLADKVENKSDLQVSADEKKLVYLVNFTGVAKTDADGTEDSLTIDYSGADSQVFTLDLGTKGAKPAQLTKSKDNKLNPSFLSDGSVVYVSADPEGNNGGVLKSISADGKTTSDLVKDIDVSLSVLTEKGKLLVVGTASDDSSRVYEVNGSATTQLYSTPGTISEVVTSGDGKLAVIEDGSVRIVQDGKATALTL